MKRLFIVTCLLILSIGVFAQNEAGQIYVQPKIGLSIADFTNDDEASPRFGLVGGVELGYQITELLGLSAGILYSMQGAENEMSYQGSNVKCQLKMDYINIPILASISLYKGLALKFGVQPGFNISSRYAVASQGMHISGNLSDTGIIVESIDFSVPIGLSYDYKNFVLEGRYNLGAMRIVKEDEPKHSVIQLTLGYKFGL